ncbi:hypothetical protein NPIL_464441 [Nephila pilipes]|uniref:Uncharacterized protein n=1 Tax=Nephila pilipes TaxID=299642 RepID=A0A8X6N620_NEPPI|nr:hypothetical protein NPIL_464441 [Nephila pilipes]
MESFCETTTMGTHLKRNRPSTWSRRPATHLGRNDRWPHRWDDSFLRLGFLVRKSIDSFYRTFRLSCDHVSRNRD